MLNCILRGFLISVILLAICRPTTAGEEPSLPAKTDVYGDPLPPNAVARIGSQRLRVGSSIDNMALSPDGRVLA